MPSKLVWLHVALIKFRYGNMGVGWGGAVVVVTEIESGARCLASCCTD